MSADIIGFPEPILSLAGKREALPVKVDALPPRELGNDAARGSD